MSGVSITHWVTVILMGLVPLSSIWMYLDARHIGARRGLVRGIAGSAPVEWLFAGLCLWILVFPLYLASRSRLRAAANAQAAVLGTLDLRPGVRCAVTSPEGKRERGFLVQRGDGCWSVLLDGGSAPIWVPEHALSGLRDEVRPLLLQIATALLVVFCVLASFCMLVVIGSWYSSDDHASTASQFSTAPITNEPSPAPRAQICSPGGAMHLGGTCNTAGDVCLQSKCCSPKAIGYCLSRAVELRECTCAFDSNPQSVEPTDPKELGEWCGIGCMAWQQVCSSVRTELKQGSACQDFATACKARCDAPRANDVPTNPSTGTVAPPASGKVADLVAALSPPDEALPVEALPVEALPIEAAASATVDLPADPKPVPRSLKAPVAMVFVAGQSANGTDTNAASDSFFVDATEVTVRDYAKCVSTHVCTEARLHGAHLTTAEYLRSSGQCNALYAERGQYPVNCVDLGQAATYCQFVVKRLPSSKEWGLVARGSDQRAAPWGSGAVDCEHAVGAGCILLEAGRSGTAPVGSRAAGASPLGVFDLLGNVAEWVWDGTLVPSGQDSPVGVLRGGAWNVALSDLSARSGSLHPARDGGPDTGFRCVRGGANAAPVNVPQGRPFDCADACETECIDDSSPKACTDTCTRACTAGPRP